MGLQVFAGAFSNCAGRAMEALADDQRENEAHARSDGHRLQWVSADRGGDVIVRRIHDFRRRMPSCLG